MQKINQMVVLGKTVTSIKQYYHHDRTYRIKFTDEFDEERKTANVFIGMSAYPMIFYNMHKKSNLKENNHLSPNAVEEIKSLWDFYTQYSHSMFEFGMYKYGLDYLLVGIDNFSPSNIGNPEEVPYIIKYIDNDKYVVESIDTDAKVYKEWKLYNMLVKE